MLSRLFEGLSRFPLACRFAVFVLVPLGVIAAVAYQRLTASLPADAGRAAVPGLVSPVRVTRDPHGVPYIEAHQDLDAYTALGFLHARDRLWQLELQRRTAQGRLAEILGADALRSDMIFRTLDLYTPAESALAALSEDARASLEAYARGINAWMESAPALPAEFPLLGVRPEPWRALDSVAWMKVFALNLAGNYQQELNRLVAKTNLSDAQFRSLFPDYPEDAPTTLAAWPSRAGQELVALADAHRQALDFVGLAHPAVGSNAWVVGGARAKGGVPVLANDPHLALQMPSYWYVVRMRGDRLNASGMSLVGLPVVVFGHNADCAWGGTSLMADVQDLYVEQLHPTNNMAYRSGEGWRAFTTRTESIAVRAPFPQFLRPRLKPVEIRVRGSEHGPIISDLLGKSDTPLALQWTALAPDDTTYEGFYRLGYAHDWASFRGALAHMVAPALNFVYADTQGSIGYAAAGRVPVRRSGKGTLPVPGHDPQFAWTGSIAPAQMPAALNPEAGYFVSANNRPAGPDYPHFISADWASPERAERIESLLLRSPQGLRAEDHRQIQQDTVDLQLKRLLPSLLAHSATSQAQAQALAALRDWNGNMSRDSRAATIAAAWLRQLRFQLFRDEFQGFWNTTETNRVLTGIRRSVDAAVITQVLEEGDSLWCDDVTTQATESCADILDRSLDAAIRSTNKLLSHRPMETWAWGEAHAAKFQHTPFSSAKILSSVFERRVPSGGFSNSINVANASYQESEGYNQTFGASFRMVIELTQPPRLSYMNTTGQSGNVISEHYDDMLVPFQEGEYYVLGDAHPQSDRVLLLTAY
ncbi:MAG: penicillin acylase family protein [Pseudomonadota bacterium]